ncbi:hypothetical protein Tco_0700531 [Tanacetum coccineum]
MFQLIQHMESLKESILERAKHKREYDKRVNDKTMQSKEGKVDSSKALNASLVVTKCSRTESDKQDTSIKSGNDITHAIDADIRPNDQVPFAETVENADLKAQIQEKVFANVALKNELRKLKGNSVDTKFAKPSILGKPVLQPPRNQSVVRQPNAFKSERPNFSKPRFASQVDVNNVLSKIVTPYYLPKVRESVFVKPHHVIASGSSKNSSKESYGSNDMAHNYYLEEAKKKTQDKNRNLKPREMPSARTHHTPNACTPKPRSYNQTSRNWPASKSSEETLKAVQKADHSRNPSSFSDSKHFVCSTCQKCVFNANHDVCLTKFLKEVNSRIKVQSPKTRNNIKPVEMITNVIKPKRWISKGYRISPNKSSAVHEKPNTPRSCLRWKPTGRIFKIAGLRWIPTGKMFTDSTTKVDSEPPNGSNDDITNPYECDQTLNVSAGTLNLSADNTSGPAPQRKEKCTIQCVYLQKKRNLRIFGLYTSSLLNAACKKALNLLKKGLLIRGKLWKLLKEEEACLTTKFNNFPKVQVKDLVLFQRFLMSQRTILVAQAAYFLNLIMKFMILTLSSAKLEIQSMMDVPINQEDPIVQRTLLIDTVILMVTDKTASTPTPPTTQAQVQMRSTSYWKDSSRESRKLCEWATENGKENGAGEEADDELRRFGLELRGENSWRN